MSSIDISEKRSCFKSQFFCLCGLGACRLCCRSCPPIKESTSTRASYILSAVFWIAIMATVMSTAVQQKIIDIFPDHVEVCSWLGAVERCDAVIGYMIVYRIGFAIFMYHMILMVCVFGVKRSRGYRAGLHNGMWFHKVILQFGLIVAAFLIPDSSDSFIKVWMYCSMIGAAIFIVIQMVLLVVMINSWIERIVNRVNAGGSICVWYAGAAAPPLLLMYALFVLTTLLLFLYYASGEGCHTNQWLIVTNAMTCVIVSIIAACHKGPHPAILRLLQSSIVSLYIMYMTWSAISSAPRKFQEGSVNRFRSVQQYYCGPSIEKSWSDNLLPFFNIFIMFVTVTYVSLGMSKPEDVFKPAVEFPENPVDTELVSRYEVEDVGGQRVIKNEARYVIYAYHLFHLMAGFAVLYMMLSLTSWYAPGHASARSFGRSWSAFWIKMGSAWACFFVYVITICFPGVMPKAREISRHSSLENGVLNDESVVPLSPYESVMMTKHQETTV